MNKTDIRKIYEERIKKFDAQLKRQKKTLSYISFLRLFAALIALGAFVAGVKTGLYLSYILSGLMLILFFSLVSYYKNQSDKKKFLSKLVLLNQTELNCLEHNFASNNNGSEFMDPDHPWAYDLDLVGEGSLFQYLNRTASHTGPEELFTLLSEPVSDEAEILQRQILIKELAEKTDLRQGYQAQSMLMESSQKEFHEVKKWAILPVFIRGKKFLRFMSYFMMILSLILIVLGIINQNYFRLLIPVLIINWSILSPYILRTNRYQEQVSKKHGFLVTYAILLDILAKQEFRDPELLRISAQCKHAYKSIKKLSSLLNLFDQRLNILVGLALNSLFLFDLHMLFALDKWTKAHSEQLLSWLDIVGKTDALFSLAGYAHNHPEHNYPLIRNSMSGFEATDLGHPMIPSEKRIVNSLHTKNEKVVLITGANMAGKSTFLRSVGINMALAYAGCPVCATKFLSGNYILYSSMRTSDSLKDEESYFLAEIKRLKKIVDKMEEGARLLILLDEVLKGTNTTDKQKGSRGLIEKCIKHELLCFIATHDLALGDMEKQYSGSIVNYCFESYIKDLELSFDYKISRGLAKNMNASFLMKKMGIME